MIQKLPFDAAKFNSLKGYVLLTTDKQDDVETTKSGIVIGKRSVLERPCYGTVVSSGVEAAPVGSVIVYPATDGIDCEFNSVAGYVLLKEESIIGTINP